MILHSESKTQLFCLGCFKQSRRDVGTTGSIFPCLHKVILNASSSARKKKEKSAYRTAIFPSYISRKITKSNIECDLTFKFHNKLSMHVLVQGVVMLSPYKIPLWTYRKSSSSEAKLFWEKYSCYSK